jgi:hypothetical protein
MTSRVHSYLRRKPCRATLALAAFVGLALISSAGAQSADKFHRTLGVSTANPVTLEIDLPRADLQVLYSREGQISITAQEQNAGAGKANPDLLATAVHLEQEGNHIRLRQDPDAKTGMNILYRLDVPYRTAVVSHIQRGKQTLSGIMGPVKAASGDGDIKASYIAGLVEAETGVGNINLEVVGEHALADVREGNISCTRLIHGVTAEAEDGDITLMVVGPSTATVKKGRGEIEVAGARGSFIGTTVAGDIHIKAVLHDDWQLRSRSGDIRIELPSGAAFEFDTWGALRVERDDIQKAEPELRSVHQNINGGGKLITARTDTGRIVIR